MSREFREILLCFLILILLTDIDDCSPDPCQNGAACTDGVNTYTCVCLAGYTGMNCETGEYKNKIMTNSYDE